ncbi:MAG: TrbI/VirB10 family protein [Opitutaceae bacterium]
MKRFLQSKLGILSLIGFTLLMAFMLHRVLAQHKGQRSETPASLSSALPPKISAPATKSAGRAPLAATDQVSSPEESQPVRTLPLSEGNSAGSSLQKDLLYLDRLRESGNHSRTDRDREGVAITRRRTATPASGTRTQDSSLADDSASVTSGKSLRLSGRIREAVASPAAQAALLPPNDSSLPAPGASASEPTANPASSAIPRFVPYGRPIKCELVFTIDSTMEETPLVGLVVEPVYNNGVLVIPAGTELHGIARPDRLRDRIFSGRDWVLVLPREAAAPNGRQLNIKGLALDRIEPQASGLTWGITDGSYGLQGAVIRTMESEEIKRFAATFVSAAALTLQERQTNSRGGRSVSSTPANAALQGIASSLEGLAREIAAEIERNGVFIRIAGGKQFYFYPQQIIAPDRASIPLSQ